MLLQQVVGARVVAGREVDLGEPEGVAVIFWMEGQLSMNSYNKNYFIIGTVLVIASTLSPMKIAASYWALLRASWRQSRRNFSMSGCEQAIVVVIAAFAC